VPGLPFFVDRDLTRPDGVIQCREVTTVEMLQLGWRLAKAVQIVTRGIPILP